MPADHLKKLLSSRERTQRFTGVKLARLRGEKQFEAQVRELASDEEEDVYVRIEAASCLVTCCGHAAETTFASYLNRADPQTQLEAVIALGETNTPDAVAMLCALLDDATQPYFLRSAAAWSLGQIGGEAASQGLADAFRNVDLALRHEALENLVALGRPAWPAILRGLTSESDDISPGCAEVLRQNQPLPGDIVAELRKRLESPMPGKWVVWLIGLLPRHQFNAAVASLQETNPGMHYAITLLWSFAESWIARNWEFDTSVTNPLSQGSTR